MGAVQEVVRERAPKSTEATMRALLQRCRAALKWSDAEWERDIETAAALDAELVKDIDLALRE